MGSKLNGQVAGVDENKGARTREILKRIEALVADDPERAAKVAAFAESLVGRSR